MKTVDRKMDTTLDLLIAQGLCYMKNISNFCRLEIKQEE